MKVRSSKYYLYCVSLLRRSSRSMCLQLAGSFLAVGGLLGCSSPQCDTNPTATQFLSYYAQFHHRAEEIIREKRQRLKQDLEMRLRVDGIEVILNFLRNQIGLQCDRTAEIGTAYRCVGNHRGGMLHINGRTCLGADYSADFLISESDQGSSGIMEYTVSGNIFGSARH